MKSNLKKKNFVGVGGGGGMGGQQQIIEPFQNGCTINICSKGLSKLRMQLKLNKSYHQTA